MNTFAGIDLGWLAVALPLLFAAFQVAVCRQLLVVFSRKRLLEIAPEPRRAEVETHLDMEDSYTASLRSADLLLRLSLVLSFAFGRVAGAPGSFAGAAFPSLVLEALLLGAELAVGIVVLLEVLPGIAARVRTEELLLRRLRSIRRIDAFFSPLRAVSGSIVRTFAVLLGGRGERPSADVLEEEILSAAEEGEREGLLKSREIDMIESIITFGNVEVSEVMTPRTEMVCLDIDEPLENDIQRAIECGHSRIPVYRESKDNIIGLLYAKDLLRYLHRKEAPSLPDILRKPHFVPLTKKIGELFQEFRTQRFHIAIILDEFGGTLGLVTIEDIIEEIVGEITDEYEKVEKPPLKMLAPGLADVDAAMRIVDFNDRLGVHLPEGDAYDTVGGFMVSQMGRIPQVGDVFELDAIRLEVTSADERRIRRLRARLPEKGEPPPA